jgi:2-polyprenyl-6-methoxyphenol hydroxylase-like FAD-dependent oxidoreductase
VTEEIIVVGGGIAGLSAALALAREGFESRLFESRTANESVDRGDVLQPGILPVLESLGAFAAIMDRNPLRFHWFRILDADGRVHFEANTIALLGADRYFLSLRHTEILAAFEQAVRATGHVDIRMGDRAISPVLDGGRVAGVRTKSGEHRAALTVIAAGANSRLTDEIFGEATIHRYRSAFYNGRVAAATGYADAACYVLGPRGATVLVPLPGKQQRVGIQLCPDDLPQLSSPGYFESECGVRFHPFADARPTLFERPRMYRLRRTKRPRWAVPGAVLVGDAVHQVHPIGGQGMNLAIRDACGLAGLIRDVPKRDRTAIDDATLRYSAVRAEAVRPVQSLTHVLGVTADNRVARSRLTLLGLRHSPKALRRRVLAAMLDVR